MSIAGSLRAAAASAIALSVLGSSSARAQCDPVDIGPNAMVQGALAFGDCTIAQLEINPDDTSFVDVYRIQLSSPGFLTLRLGSGAFDAFLWLFDSALADLIDLDDDGGTGTNSLLSRIPVAAGTYLVLANSFFEGDTGTYTLTTEFEATTQCDVVVDLPPSAVVQGTLSESDCIVAQLGIDPTDRSFVDQYRVVLPAGGPLTVRLESAAFDAFLAVFDSTLTELIDLDDDGGGGTDSLLSDLMLEPGTYLVLANSFFDEETGPYTLTLVPEPAGALLGAAALAAAIALARARGRSGLHPRGARVT